MRAWAPTLLLIATVMLQGCQAPRPLTPTQLDALQVRLVEASPDRAFGAASSALLDAGYQVRVSDVDAGVLTGEKREDPAVAANVAVMILSALAQAPTDLAPTYHAVSVQVLPVSASRSNVRIRPFLNGLACPCTESDKNGRAVVDQLWGLMQRQVLMKEASRPGS